MGYIINHRHFSLISTASKVRESIIYSHLFNNCNKFNLINTEQHSFGGKQKFSSSYYFVLIYYDICTSFFFKITKCFI